MLLWTMLALAAAAYCVARAVKDFRDRKYVWAALTDIADQLAAADEAAGLGDDLAHVPVKADEAAAVRDLDFAAVAAGPARADHLAIGRGDDRAAPSGADVDSGVEAREVQNRM